jgi:hypothetical protein
MIAGRLAPASEVAGHSGSSLDIFFFVSYVSLNLSDDVFEVKKIPIKRGKLVYGEVTEFFLQNLIFAVFSTVLGVFRPFKHRIYAQLRTNKCITYLKQPYSSTFI